MLLQKTTIGPRRVIHCRRLDDVDFERSVPLKMPLITAQIAIVPVKYVGRHQKDYRLGGLTHMYVPKYLPHGASPPPQESPRLGNSGSRLSHPLTYAHQSLEPIVEHGHRRLAKDSMYLTSSARKKQEA